MGGESCNLIAEVEKGLLTSGQVEDLVNSGGVVRVQGRIRDVLIGDGVLAKIVGLTGLGTDNDRDAEVAKIDAFNALSYGPDIVADLSVRDEGAPLYEHLVGSFAGPVSTVPAYRCFDAETGKIDSNKLLSAIEHQASIGVSYMVVHATLNAELLALSRGRQVSFTSRGGFSTVRDMQVRGADHGIYADIFPEVMDIMRRHNVVLSLGTTFRPSTNQDCLDATHKAELLEQRKYIELAREAGVQVILEALSHARLDQIDQFLRFVQDDPVLSTVPMGALGPLGTDTANGFDHAAMAATASYAAYKGAAHFFSMVTRTEHTGGIPTKEDQLEALRCLRTSLRVADSGRFPQLESAVAFNRGRSGQTCLLRKGQLFPEMKNRGEDTGPCVRCGDLCPYLESKVA